MLNGAKCPVCRQGTIREVARTGRVEDFHGEKALSIPADIPIPECDSCHQTWFNDTLAARLDKALWAAWRHRHEAA